MTYVLTIDTGGTFTDLVIANDTDVLGLYKSPTTRDDPFVAVTDVVEQAAADEGLTLQELLTDTSVFIYSTTAATNAILEGTTAKTAFFTTEGHRDILLYREGGKPQPHNLALPYPDPYVPRHLTFGIRERIVSDGSVEIPLDEESVAKALDRCRELGVEAIGVCLLWSVLNPAHEEQVGVLIEEHLPGVSYSLGSRVNRIVREYRRATATVLDASIKPLMGHHLNDVDRRLRSLGFAGEPLMVTHISGGVLGLDEMVTKPIHTVDSGPALAPVAGQQYAAAESGLRYDDQIVVDTGGTSFDASLIRQGSILYTREKWLGKQWEGHMTGLPAVDTRSIGSGGGSIAYVDSGGLLHVGPESAGADPGPACYERGGEVPTLTDAAVVLGFIDPEYFLGGRFPLNAELARKAVAGHVAEVLGLSIEGAADAIMAVSTEAMRGFIADMTVTQGLSPRECLLIAGGGAAGLNIVSIARELSVAHVVIPTFAAGLSAVGGQYSDLMTTFSRGLFTTSASFDFEAVNGVLAELAREVNSFFDQVGPWGPQERRMLCEARYANQVWELDVDLEDKDVFKGTDDILALQEGFDERHLQIFAVNDPGGEIETTAWRAEGRVIRTKPELPMRTKSSVISDEDRSRVVFFSRDTGTETRVVRGGSLSVGEEVDGPLIVEEPTTTVVVPPGARLVTKGSHYLLETGG